MFHFFSKLFWLFGVLTRYSTLGASRCTGQLAAIGILSLFVASCTPVGNWLMLPLENRFPRWQGNPEVPDGIIALGGEERARVSALVELGRRFPKSRLFLVGFGNQTDELRARIIGLGFDPERLVTESKSRNTSENALNAATIIKPQLHQHWILITSSWHMPRAVGCFRASGFNVNAYPVDFSPTNYKARATLKLNPESNFTYLKLAAKEWVGLIAYRLEGKTHEFFPAP